MKLHGDVPEEDRKLAEQLELSERDVDKVNDVRCPNSRKAQAYTCLAHDWYQLGADEEGSRLLLKAESIFPGYFKGSVIKEHREGKDFNLLMENLTKELATILINNLSGKV